jgi:CheY-like chemotaxis protein
MESCLLEGEAGAEGHPVDIVIVDDDEETRDTLASVLESSGYRVSTATSGRQALDALAGMPVLPRLVLLDLIMPGMSGDELVHELKRQPRLAGVPVVLFSGASELRRRSSQLAVAGWLSKPGSLEDLLDLVERFAR